MAVCLMITPPPLASNHIVIPDNVQIIKKVAPICAKVVIFKYKSNLLNLQESVAAAQFGLKSAPPGAEPAATESECKIVSFKRVE